MKLLKISLPYSILLLSRSPSLSDRGWSRIPDRFWSSSISSLALLLSPDLFKFPADILVAACQRLVLLSKDLVQIQLVHLHRPRSLQGSISISRLLPSEEWVLLCFRWAAQTWDWYWLWYCFWYWLRYLVVHILPGFHRGAVQAWHLLPQPRALLQRGNQLISGWKTKTWGKRQGWFGNS